MSYTNSIEKFASNTTMAKMKGSLSLFVARLRENQKKIYPILPVVPVTAMITLRVIIGPLAMKNLKIIVPLNLNTRIMRIITMTGDEIIPRDRQIVVLPQTQAGTLIMNLIDILAAIAKGAPKAIALVGFRQKINGMKRMTIGSNSISLKSGTIN
jgi:hypothetical protein